MGTHRIVGRPEDIMPQKHKAVSRIKRKSVNVDQAKLDRAMRILGTRSESHAIDQALELLIFREELVAGMRRIGGTGGVENYFEP